MPDSSWFTNRILARPIDARRAVARSADRRRPGAGPWTRGLAEAGRLRARLHHARCRAASAGSSRSTPPAIPKPPPARSPSPTRSSGRSATGRSRTISSSVNARRSWSSPIPRCSRRRRDASAACSRAISTPSCSARIAAPTARYRAIAARAVTGRPIGGFRYYGTRPDDPNDVVPHEHRRELRALKVFGAWTNLVDMKAGNTLDTVVDRERPQRRAPLPAGRRLDVRHRRQRPARIRRRLGAALRRRAAAEAAVDAELLHRAVADRRTTRSMPAIGRFEGDRLRSAGVAAARRRPRRLRHARSDDTFWAARRVAAFTDDMIRAVVRTGEYSDPAAADAPGRRADQAAAEDCRGVSAGDQSARRLRALRRRTLELPQCGGRRRRGARRRRRLSRRVVVVRQRDRRGAIAGPGLDLAATQLTAPGCCRRPRARSCASRWRRSSRHRRRGCGRPTRISGGPATAGQLVGIEKLP